MSSRLSALIVASTLMFNLCGCAHAQTAAPATQSTAKFTAEDASIQRAVDEAHAMFRDLNEGKNADYIPALAKVDSKLFGVAVVTVDGRVFTAGDIDAVFSIQSVSKVFTAAMVIEEQGVQGLADKIGVEPTGMRFNSIIAIEMHKNRPSNPLVNAGAIAATSLVKASSAAERWKKIMDNLSGFAGRDLTVLEDVYVSEAATNERNQSIARLLQAHGRLYSDPAEATDVYTKQCSVGVTAKDLAVMGATLANGGKNPITGKVLMKSGDVPELLAVMTMAGFYDESGKWAYEVGLPAKTGVGGGIVAVVPGKMAIAAFSPPVNEAGNSVRAQKAIAEIAKRLNAGVFNASAK